MRVHLEGASPEYIGGDLGTAPLITGGPLMGTPTEGKGGAEVAVAVRGPGPDTEVLRARPFQASRIS
jgi:hypothetical protein